MKKPFRINLSRRHWPYLAPARLALVVLAVALGVGILWDLQYASNLTWRAEDVEPALARVLEQDRAFLAQARAEGIDLSDAALQRLPRDIAFANRLIAERTFSWTKLLGQLEETVPDGLAINSVQHDLGKSVSIRLTGVANTLELVTAFTLALDDHAAFYDPELGQHRLKEQLGVVEFSLKVGYHGEAL